MCCLKIWRGAGSKETTETEREVDTSPLELHGNTEKWLRTAVGDTERGGKQRGNAARGETCELHHQLPNEGSLNRSSGTHNHSSRHCASTAGPRSTTLMVIDGALSVGAEECLSCTTGHSKPHHHVKTHRVRGKIKCHGGWSFEIYCTFFQSFVFFFFSCVNTQNPSQETGEGKEKKHPKSLSSRPFSLMHVESQINGASCQMRHGCRTLKDSKKPPPPPPPPPAPPPPPFSSLSSSPPRPIMDWLFMCSSSYRVSNRAERVRSCPQHSHRVSSAQVQTLTLKSKKLKLVHQQKIEGYGWHWWNVYDSTASGWQTAALAVLQRNILTARLTFRDTEKTHLSVYRRNS